MQLLNKKLLEGYKHSTWCDFLHATLHKYVFYCPPMCAKYSTHIITSPKHVVKNFLSSICSLFHKT